MPGGRASSFFSSNERGHRILHEMNLDSQQNRSKAQFTACSESYGKNHVLSQTDDLRSASPHLKPKPGERLLDVATGNGHCAIYYAKQGLEVTASDLSPAMLKRAKDLAESENCHIDFHEHQAEALPYEDGAFDIVTCRVAAHHFSCPATFMMEVRRVLKKAGRFLLIDGTVEDGYPKAEAWAHAVESLRDPSHHRLIRPDQWTHLCGHVGMKVFHREIQPLKQPDLGWYFEAAATTPENRKIVRERVQNAPEEAVRLFKISKENDEWTWFWQRLILIARKL
jgi:ubiquinone/menaquinone biosynthesis C-methylase UbiE